MKQPIFLSLQKIPINSHNFFGSYVAQIFPNFPLLAQELFPNNYSSFLSSVAFCEGSATYPFLIAPKPFGHSLMSKSLPHDKIQLYLPSQSSSAIFQTFCRIEGIVKEVLPRSFQMSWNFAHSLMCSYHDPPPSFSSILSSM